MAAWLSQARALLRRRSVWFGLLALGLIAASAGLAYWFYRVDQEATRLRQLADKDLERQDLPAASAHLRSYLAVVPASADGRFLLAQTLRREGKYDEAEHELAEASRLGWDPEAVRREQVLARLQRWGVRERSGAELTALAQAPAADRPLWEALYRGDLAARNWDRAGFWLYLWLERWPDDWAPRLWQADLLERFKNYDRARADYLRVLELRPDDPRALLKVGLIAVANRGDYDEAEAYLKRCLEREPGNAEATLGLARCAYARGDLPAARAGAQAVLAGNPRHAGAALLLGMIDAEAGRDEEALAPLRVAEAEGADPLRVHFQLAQALRRLGRADEADKHSRLYSELREAHRAREAAVRAAEQEPHNADRQYEVGRLSMVVGEEDAAARQFLSALKLDPGHRPSHAALADYYARQSDPDAAALAEHHRRLAQPDARPSPKRPDL
jgi:tetratricopeptide (TPR) repeat protein